MTPQRTSIIAIVLAIVGIMVGGFGVYRAATVQGELTTAMTTAQASSDQTKTALGEH
jgi:hypothetical protein